MKSKLLLILSLFFHYLAIKAQDTSIPEIHCKHFFGGYPLGSPKTNDLIIRDLYALSNNDRTKFADWVAYRLTPYEVFGELDLDREWRNDPWLDDYETLEAKPKNQDDYKDAGDFKFDRGHLAPLASFKGSRNASQANFYSNIVPQKAELNQGPWRILEDKIRKIASETRTVYVMVGTLYERKMPEKLPAADEDYVIPSGFWQVIVIPTSTNERNFQVMAFIFDQNTPRNSDLMRHLVSVNEVEKRSKLNLFWALDDDIENQIETEANLKYAEKVLGK
jgi:endonuclease G, mitochondrial